MMFSIARMWVARGFLGWLLMLAGLSAMAFGQEPATTEDARQKQIAELRKQIEELQRKLDQLAAAEKTTKPEEPARLPLPAEWLKPLEWRSIGPANMGGRIVSLAVRPEDPSTYWVATASAGLLKTVNGGMTFEHQFDHESTVSIGDVCVAPSDPKIVWVGTGENNPRNSVSYGDGVYKSTDGGKTWTNMGLKESFQIGRIVIHPKNPDIVYVGALGRLYGPSEQRGLFKTTDGGKTWEKIHYVDDKTGVIDIRMHPNDPETLLIATYQRKRDLYDTNDPEVKWGPGSGLYKTTDGGKTWNKLTKGLPTCNLGRIGIDYYQKDPNQVFIILESEKIGSGPPQAQGGNAYMGIVGDEREDKAQLAEVVEGGPADKAGLKAGDIITEIAEKPIRTYDDLIERIRGHKAGDKVMVKASRAGKPVEVEVTLVERPAAGPGRPVDPKHPFLDSLGGQRENVQGRQGDDGFQYGGVYRSTDGGESWERVNSLNPRPMYFSQVRVDPEDSQFVYVLGVSLYRSRDGGKTFRPDGGRGVHADQHALWIDPRDGRHMIVGCDGGLYETRDRMDHWDHLNHAALGQFYDVALDTRRVYNVYGGLQDNGSWGGPSRTLSQTGPINEDWFNVGGGDGFSCQVDPNDPDQVYFTGQNGALGRRHLRTGEVAFLRPRAPEGKTYRFNWNTPFLLSNHNSRIYYCAGNYVFRSLDRGSDLRVISPEITRTDRGSATAISESPRNPNVLYVGTDDGALWVTKNGGGEWTEISKNVGIAGPRYVASLDASRFEDGRVYVAFDGHRSDDDAPLAYVSEDFGTTWTSLNQGLPRGSTRVLREDLENPNLLFLGTEFAAFVSVDRGRSWASLNTNLPTVAVHEFAIHPTVGEVVAATHGRSLWILDATPLRQTTAEVLNAPSHLFRPNTYVQWHAEPNHGRTNRRFVGQNPPNGVPIYYSLAKKAEKVSLRILDIDGTVLRTLEASREPGLHRAIWDVTRLAPRPPRRNQDAGPGQGEPSNSEEEAAPPSQPRRGPARPQPVPPGTYRVVLTVDGKDLSRTVQVEPDPNGPSSGLAAEEVEDLFEDDDEQESLDRIDR